MITLNKSHLEVLDYLDEKVSRNDMAMFNRYFNLGITSGLSELKRVLSVCPWCEGMPDLTGKVISFANGTSAYVIAQFKHGSDIYLQVAKPEEGPLLKYDWYGYTKDTGMTILTVEEPLITFEPITDNTESSSSDIGLTEFGTGGNP